MKKLYINGSSITSGWPLNRKSIIDLYHEHYNIDKWADGDSDDVMYSESNRLVNWPTRLSKLLNIDLVDESRHGGSVNRVIRMTYEYIENNNIDDTLFILEFPSGYRDELFSIKLDRLFNITIGNVQDIGDGTELRSDNKKVFNELNSYFKNFVDQETHFKKEFLSFVGLISYMKSMNVNFLIINQSITDEYSEYYPQIFKSLDIEDRIVKWDGGDCIVKWYLNDNNLHLGGDFKHITGYDDYHPGYFGHIKIAEYLYRYLRDSFYAGKYLNHYTGEYVYLNDSPIHGIGLFAKQKIIKNTIINNIVIQRGIWNHSTKPNCVVVVGEESEFNIFDLKTIKDIEKDEEILVDYRNLNEENSKFKGMDLL